MKQWWNGLRLFSLVALSCVAVCCVFPGVLLAQPGDAPDEPSAVTTDRTEERERLATLAGILESVAAIEKEVEELEGDYRRAETDEQQQAVSQQIEDRRQRVEELQRDFSVLAAGIDRESFFEQSAEAFDWREELEGVFAPVILEIKAASAHPREVESLRSELAVSDKRLPAIEDALTSLQRLAEGNDSEVVGAELEELTEYWTRQRDELTTHYASTQQRLEEKEREELGLGHATAEILRIFFRKRFTNLLIALLVFVAIFLVLRALHRLARRYMKGNVSHSRQLLVRLIDIAYYVFTISAAILGLLVVFYLSADWILLTLAVLILVGAIWAMRSAVPIFFEQVKLLLNVGAVREGERMRYQGIPWKVVSLNFFTELENPALRGGFYRLPLKDLVGLRSRPLIEKEPWFPSQMGDWVIANDGTYGEVVEQTPEVVVLSTVRGSHKHYPTVDYLEQHPKNLSSNAFSVNHTVGLDYRYRNIVNTEIVDKLKQGIQEGFTRQPYGEHLMQVIVEFKEMGASSLDIITIAKFKGGAASEYWEIGWKLQQLALDVCNENDWEIPFPQMVLHRADGAGPVA